MQLPFTPTTSSGLPGQRQEVCTWPLGASSGRNTQSKLWHCFGPAEGTCLHRGRQCSPPLSNSTFALACPQRPCEVCCCNDPAAFPAVLSEVNIHLPRGSCCLTPTTCCAMKAQVRAALTLPQATQTSAGRERSNLRWPCW